MPNKRVAVKATTKAPKGPSKPSFKEKAGTIYDPPRAKSGPKGAKTQRHR